MPRPTHWPHSAPPLPAADPLEPAAGEPPAGPPRVLLIDDNRSNLELMSQILAGEDDGATRRLEALESSVFGAAPAARAARPQFAVERCEDGQNGRDRAARAHAAGQPFALAFVDMRMPGGWDGLQTIEALWQVQPDLQVVICSAYADHSWEEISARLGRSDSLLILRKPFDPIEVLQLACALTEKWRLQRARQDQLNELERLVAQRTRHLHAALGERQQVERELQHQATHDALTGLANRPLLLDRLQQAIAQASRRRRQLLVVFIDLDRFKLINDSLGHECGDQLLQTVARRMAGCLRDSDTLARLGGDEFVLLLPDLDQANAGMPVVTRLLDCVAEPLTLAGQSLSLTCSVGCSAYPADGCGADDLLRFADSAMYRAKELGRNNVQVYNADLRARIDQRVRLESALRHAIERDELSLHYQPQVDLRNGRIQGLEALLRWHCAELGDIEPARFIPLAEDSGLIDSLGEWALYRACEQLLDWQRQGLPAVRVAVNLSAKQLRPGLDQLLARCLAETGVDPANLELELTESASMDDPERIIPLLQRLRELGVSLSIDDFGSGYSNMRYLKLFPVQKLKLDGAFIREITTDAGSMAIVDAAIAMAHRLGLKVVAEMAETEGQVMQLAAHGCDQVQGYYFSRPLSAAQLTPLLRAGQMALPPTLGRDDSRRRVLILDDEQSVTSTLKRALRHQDYQVLTANNANEAFDLLARQPVGVVLSDQRMPDMLGSDFLDQVRMLYPDAVRILFTGYTDFTSAQKAINQGAVHRLIAKPWNNQELNQVISQALEQHERARHDPHQPVPRGAPRHDA